MRTVFLRSVCTLAILGVLALPVLTDATSEWYDYHRGLYGGSATHPLTQGDSHADLDFESGLLWLRAEIQGGGPTGRWWSWVRMGKTFTYGGYDNASVHVLARSKYKGFMDIGPGSQTHNGFDLRVELRDMTDGVDTVVTTRHFTSFPKVDQNWSTAGSIPANIDFDTDSLLNGREYAAVLFGNVWSRCDTLELGTTEVDFHWHDDLGEIDLVLIDWYWNDTFTSGGDTSGDPNLRFLKQWTQLDYYKANKLSFELRDDKYKIRGWRADITDFPYANSYYPAPPSTETAYIEAYYDPGEGLQRYQQVIVQGKVWGSSKCGNHFEIRNQHWHPMEPTADHPAQGQKFLPDYYWEVSPPDTLHGVPDNWRHVFTMKNAERSGGDTLKVRDLTIMPTLVKYNDLSTVDFSDGLSIPDFDLAPQVSYFKQVFTGADPLMGGYIYVNYKLLNAAGDSLVCNAWGEHLIPDTTLTLTGVGEQAPLQGYRLYQNVPNPFNPTTVIRYDVPAGDGKVTLRIYDVSGRLVRTLVNDVQTTGRKSVIWDARDNRGQSVASGVYFYRMTAPGFEKTRKMVLLQ